MVGAPTHRASFIERMFAALRLELEVYREVSTDTTANGQAFGVVLLSGLSNGLALTPRLGNVGVAAGIGAAVVGWWLWVGVILLVAAALGHRRNGRSLLRALGFANAPGILLIAGAVPAIGAGLRAAIVVWLVAATVVGVQAVFEVARRRAALISIAGFIAYLLLGAVSNHLAAL